MFSNTHALKRQNVYGVLKKDLVLYLVLFYSSSKSKIIKNNNKIKPY